VIGVIGGTRDAIRAIVAAVEFVVAYGSMVRQWN